MITQEQLYIQPTSVEEAIQAASEHEENFKFLAGGTDLMVNRFQGNDTSDCLIDLTKIEALKSIDNDGKYLSIGALIQLDNLQNSKGVVSNFPVLIEAAQAVASPMIRKTATIGGNLLCENRCIYYNQSEFWREAVGYCLKCDGDICIASGGTKACFSKFISDMAPALISLHAVVDITDKDGEQSLPAEELYTGDGINSKVLSKTALLTKIRIPLDTTTQCIFKKLRSRESIEFSSLTTAVSLSKNNEIKIAAGGVDPKPVVATADVSDDMDDLIKKVVKKSRALDNDVYSRKYRKEMLALFIKQSIETLTKK